MRDEGYGLRIEGCGMREEGEVIIEEGQGIKNVTRNEGLRIRDVG